MPWDWGTLYFPQSQSPIPVPNPSPQSQSQSLDNYGKSNLISLWSNGLYKYRKRGHGPVSTLTRGGDQGLAKAELGTEDR